VEILALVLRSNPARSAGKIFGVCSLENWKNLRKKR
jgi:hypothetical protein